MPKDHTSDLIVKRLYRAASGAVHLMENWMVRVKHSYIIEKYISLPFVQATLDANANGTV